MVLLSHLFSFSRERCDARGISHALADGKNETLGVGMEIIYKKLSATALFRDSHYFIGENRGRLV